VYTNAAIFHRELLNDYTCALPKSLRDMVTKIHSCEDIVMNVMAYAKWETNPIGIVTDKQCVDNYGVGPKFKRNDRKAKNKGVRKQAPKDDPEWVRQPCPGHAPWRWSCCDRV